MEEEEFDDDAAPVAAPPPAEPAFYYADAGKPALGPCTVAQLRVLWISGHISKATSLWREGMPAWLLLVDIPEVYGALSALKQPPTAGADVWYYTDASNRQRGVTAEQMGVLLKRGEVDGLTSVWREGMSAWAELGSVPELRGQLRQGDDDDDDDDDDERLANMERLAAQMAYDPDAEVYAAGSRSSTAPVGASAGSSAGASSATAGTAGGAGGASAAPKRVRSKSKKGFVKKGGANAYVSGLPDDVTVDEVVECFKVAGVLKTDPGSGEARVKLYTDSASGGLKGDALVSFLKPESVALAVTLRDGFELRPGCVLKVQPAKFEKRDGEAAGSNGGAGGGASGGGGRRMGKEEQAARKKQRLLERKALSEWEAGLSGTGKRNATVVITGLFDAVAIAAAAAEDDGGAAFYENLKQDVEVECRKAGVVDKVTVFQGSERGAAAIKFKIADDAERCAAMLDERTFGQAVIRCEVYDGVTDYRAASLREASAAGGSASAGPAGGGSSSGGGAAGNEAAGEEDEEAKLDAFGDWLEADSTDEDVGPEED